MQPSSWQMRQQLERQEWALMRSMYKATRSIGAFGHLLMRMSSHCHRYLSPDLLEYLYYDNSRRSDLLNERLPEFNPEQVRPAIFPTPSMRVARRGSGDLALDVPPGGSGIEELIKKTLEEELEGEGGVVEKLAERIARGRRVTGRPSALKRHDTA